MLGVRVDHAVQCDAGRCRLWLIDAPGARVTGARAATGTAPGGQPEMDAPVQTDAAEGAEGAEQAPPTWEPLQPDPRGLFPTD